MNSPDNGHNTPKRFRGSRPETEEKYREAIELYRSTRLSCTEISRVCGVTASVLRGYISKHHRDLMLARYNIVCNLEEARHIKLQLTNSVRTSVSHSRRGVISVLVENTRFRYDRFCPDGFPVRSAM